MIARVKRAGVWGIVAAAAVVLVSIGVAAFAWQEQSATAEDGTPTTVVQSGDVAVEVHATAEVRASKAALLSAPGVPVTLQIVEIAPTGGRVRAGDVVVQFDPAEQEYQLGQSRSQLAQVEEDLRKLDDDTTVKKSQHEIDIMKAKFALRRAELDLRSPPELVGKIQAEKNRLAFDEAQRRLQQLEGDVATLLANARASRAALEEKRNKSRLDVEGAERNIERMTLRAPFDGIALAQENRDAAGGIFFGMPMPEYRQGDVVQPGRVVAEVFDPAALDIIARIGEADGSNVSPGQRANVQLYPDWNRTLQADVVSVSGSRPRFFWEMNTRQLELVLRVTGDATGLQPGWSGTVVITGEPIRNATHVPRQAIVERDGKSFIYVQQGAGFVATPIKVRRRTDTAAVIEGLAAGRVVALRNPDAARTAAPAATPPAAPAARTP